MSFTFSNGIEIFSEDNSIGLNVTQPRRTMDINGDLGITGNIYIGTTSFVDNSAKIGINTTGPLTSIHVNATDGIVIPVGTNAQRVDVTGAVRYNTDNSTFEGYSGTWGSLGGVIDVDQDTYITAENSASADNDQLRFFTSGSERLMIDVGGDTTIKNNIIVDGNLVVGSTSAVNGKIEIVGNIGSKSITTNSYLKSTTSGTFIGISGASTNNSYSLYADGKIAALEFNAISDIRVKEIKNERNINDDLNIIKNIKTYNYEFLDKLEHQDTKKIGFIAQEIEKINQDFVNKSKRFIPNIYKVFHFVAEDEIEIYNDTDININDILKIEVKHSITNSYESFIVKVIDKQENKIKIYGKEYNINKDDILFDENVFIYGKFVNDFLTIDINQILSINTNCIKYLINKIEDYDRDITIIKKKLNI
ncbi:uncharacterized protein METZ01_LOCUS97455 [marine metagenome]|uniref:Peptidase S74 domain-containing protein n=1 Tax=marine metagenome TaxID=408172 RepID=A0A381VWW8_9ZZZZ